MLYLAYLTDDKQPLTERGWPIYFEMPLQWLFCSNILSLLLLKKNQAIDFDLIHFHYVCFVSPSKKIFTEQCREKEHCSLIMIVKYDIIIEPWNLLNLKSWKKNSWMMEKCTNVSFSCMCRDLNSCITGAERSEMTSLWRQFGCHNPPRPPFATLPQ